MIDMMAMVVSLALPYEDIFEPLEGLVMFHVVRQEK